MSETPALSADWPGTISVVVPAYNEADQIRRTIHELTAYLTPRFGTFEIIVVDDGSTDGTSSEAKALSHPAVRVLRNDPNRGKGWSVRRGVLEAAFDPVLFTDADLSTPIPELEALLEPLRDGSDAAIASRRMPKSVVDRSLPRRFLGWGFSSLVSLLVVNGFRDTQCGFKVFRRAAARALFEKASIERWGFDVEILALARQSELRVAEVPVCWRQSTRTRVRFWTPLQMAVELFKIRGLLRVAKRGHP